MIPVAFDEENTILQTPPGTPIENCEAISVFAGPNEGGYPVIVSCWKMTREEVDEVQRTGRIWMTVLGYGMQPVVLSGTSPFKGVEHEEDDA